MQHETLLKTDDRTIAVKAEKDGKFTVNSSAWDDRKTILADQVLELRWVEGQVHLLRRAKTPLGAPSAPDPGEDDFSFDDEA